MIPSQLQPLANHLWQSTLFAAVAGLLTLALRKNRAQTRYWLWLAASVKFLVPFSVLVEAGSHFGRQAPVALTHSNLSAAIGQVGEPFSIAIPLAAMPAAQSSSASLIPAILCAAWTVGFATLICSWWLRWRCLRVALRAASPLDLPIGMPAMSSAAFPEPGVAGILRPVLLLPAGIASRVTPPQFEAILTHELCHVRRRDNLAAVIHMAVEAMYWFHPLVWWLGARLMEERERACDEEVLRMGCEPQVYAEGILKICDLYLESSLPCVAGVTGANLKKRIEAIMANRIALRLNFAKKLALAVAGMAALAAPIVVGIGNVPYVRAQSPQAKSGTAAAPKFEAISIKPCNAFRKGTVEEDSSPDTLRSECTTVERLLQQAYGLFANGHVNPLSSVTVTGGPAWAGSDLYEIDAKTKGPQSRATMNGPMLQALLEDRFKLRVHRETRVAPVYELTAAKGGPKLQPFQGSCTPWDWDHPNPGPLQCGTSRLTNNGLDVKAATMADLCMFFLVTLDRRVIDKTGMAGRFDFHLELPAEELGFFRRAHGLPALSDPAVPATDPSVISAIKTAITKLGLNLEPARSPGEFLVIDSVERPSED
jgi:uncharacterized protein (TIGR03435 family)